MVSTQPPPLLTLLLLQSQISLPKVSFPIDPLLAFPTTRTIRSRTHPKTKRSKIKSRSKKKKNLLRSRSRSRNQRRSKIGSKNSKNFVIIFGRNPTPRTPARSCLQKPSKSSKNLENSLSTSFKSYVVSTTRNSRCRKHSLLCSWPI